MISVICIILMDLVLRSVHSWCRVLECTGYNQCKKRKKIKYSIVLKVSGVHRKVLHFSPERMSQFKICTVVKVVLLHKTKPSERESCVV